MKRTHAALAASAAAIIAWGGYSYTQAPSQKCVKPNWVGVDLANPVLKQMYGENCPDFIINGRCDWTDKGLFIEPK